MTEQVIDIRDRIEKMRTQMTGSNSVAVEKEKKSFQSRVNLSKKNEISNNKIEKLEPPTNLSQQDLKKKIEIFRTILMLLQNLKKLTIKIVNQVHQSIVKSISLKKKKLKVKKFIKTTTMIICSMSTKNQLNLMMINLSHNLILMLAIQFHGN